MSVKARELLAPPREARTPTDMKILAGATSAGPAICVPLEFAAIFFRVTRTCNLCRRALRSNDFRALQKLRTGGVE